MARTLKANASNKKTQNFCWEIYFQDLDKWITTNDYELVKHFCENVNDKITVTKIVY